MADDFSDYLKHLIEARQRSQESFDKTVVLLASGALGLSFSVTKDLLGSAAQCAFPLLLLSWVFWTCSLVMMLGSYLTSHQSLSISIRQARSKEPLPDVPGGVWTGITVALNLLGGICFALGTILFAVLVGVAYG